MTGAGQGSRHVVLVELTDVGSRARGEHSGKLDNQPYAPCVMPVQSLHQYHSNLFSSGLSGKRRCEEAALLIWVDLRLDPYEVLMSFYSSRHGRRVAASWMFPRMRVSMGCEINKPSRVIQARPPHPPPFLAPFFPGIPPRWNLSIMH